MLKAATNNKVLTNEATMMKFRKIALVTKKENASDNADLNTENDILSEAKAFQNGVDKQNLDPLNSSVTNLQLNDNLF